MKKKDFILIVLSWVPFFITGHLKNQTNWFWALVIYGIFYGIIGNSAERQGKNTYLSSIIHLLPVIAFATFLSIDIPEYYFPGHTLAVTIIGITGYFIGKFEKVSNWLIKIGSIVIAISILYLWHYVLLPRYTYDKMINQGSFINLVGKPVNIDFQDLNGIKIIPSTTKNKIVILDFWFVGCKSCVEKQGDVEILYNKFKDNPNVFFASVAVGNLSSLRDVKEYVRKHPTQIPIWYDPEGEFVKKYNLGEGGYPIEIRIDRNSIVQQSILGAAATDVYILEGIKFITNMLNSL